MNKQYLVGPSEDVNDPGYVVFQVKEKLGELRFYFGMSDPRCCAQWAAAYPAPEGHDPTTIAEHDRRWLIHLDSPEHEVEMGRLATIRSQAEDLVHEAEVAAGRTCEVTGGRGLLMATPTGWRLTVDPARAYGRFPEIVCPVTRDNLRQRVERAGDDPAELRRTVWAMQDDIEHLTSVAQSLLDALRRARGVSMPGADHPPEL